MKVNTVTKTEWGSEEIKFCAVFSGNAEDNSFSQSTPNGEISLTISNKALHGKLNPGQTFYVDFTEALPAAAN